MPIPRAPVPNSEPLVGEAIRCDCCGKEIMAMRRDGKIIIIGHRHGKKHFAAVPLDKTEKP